MKVLICGPESTGKTTLASQLASQFQVRYVPEQSRDYLNRLKRPYQLADVLAINELQARAEHEADLKSESMLFCDTGYINVHIWLWHRFGVANDWLQERVPARHYDFALLMEPDLDWQPDPLRENSGRSDYFFDRFLMELKSRLIPFATISGKGEDRTNRAIQALDQANRLTM